MLSAHSRRPIVGQCQKAEETKQLLLFPLGWRERSDARRLGTSLSFQKIPLGLEPSVRSACLTHTNPGVQSPNTGNRILLHTILKADWGGGRGHIRWERTAIRQTTAPAVKLVLTRRINNEGKVSRTRQCWEV